MSAPALASASLPETNSAAPQFLTQAARKLHPVLALLACSALLLAACGGSGGGSGSAAGSNAQPATSSAASSSAGASASSAPFSCPAAATSNAAYACAPTSTLSGTLTWSLSEAPEGMVVQARSGVLHWTPSSIQTGLFAPLLSVSNGTNTLSARLPITVTAGAADPAGLYVSPTGLDSNDGSAAHPLLTLSRAMSKVSAGGTIFLRGGDYYNAEYGQSWASRTQSTLAQATVAGTAAAPITLRPFGNEYARLISDVSGLVMKANYWTVQGLELQGSAAALDYATAMANWWVESGNRISGRGIVTNGADHLTISDCVIHDFPAAGITNNASAEFLTVRNNVVYNNAWWTTAGTHGISVSSPPTSSDANAALTTIFITGNLVFANQSLIVSHVFSKGRVALAVDEGNGLHLQNDTGAFRGHASVTANLALFNGKAGLGLNTIDQVSALNNAFYLNARVVDTGELVLQSSTLAAASANLFQPRSERRTIKDFAQLYANVGANATTGTLADGTDFPTVSRLSAVFNAPAAGDFAAASGVPAGYGVPAADLLRMQARVAEYGIALQAPSQTVDSAYLTQMKRDILNSWPASAEFAALQLEDRATGYIYSYSTRCYYPAAPGSLACP